MKKVLVLFACLLGLISVEFSMASIPASSTFDNGLDGWTFVGSGRLSYQSTGGNPGRFVRYDDISGTGGDGWIIAPEKFLGSWTSLDGKGTLSWDHKILQTGGSPTILKASVTFSGPSGSAIYYSPKYFTTQWQQFSVPIDRSSWSISGSWENLLANVTMLKIRIEACHNGGPGLDIDGIDNVMLVPEPTTILSFGLLLVSYFLKRRV